MRKLLLGVVAACFCGTLAGCADSSPGAVDKAANTQPLPKAANPKEKPMKAEQTAN